jgi:hypothetical protein
MLPFDYPLRTILFAVMLLALPFSGLAAPATSPSPPEVKELEEAILATRRSIATGHFRLVYRWREPAAGTSGINTFSIWLDGTLRRQDYESEGVVHIDCIGEGYHYLYKHGLGPFALTATKLEDLKRENLFMYDPRITMMYPTSLGFAHNYHMETIINSPRRKDFTLEPTEWEGKPAVQVSCRIVPSNSRLTYRAVPSLNHSIVFMELVSEGSKIKYVDTARCTLQRIGEKFWFPKRAEQQRTEDGKPTHASEVDIEVVSINQPVPPEEFTPAGMNVPPETTVAVIPPIDGKQFKWDGKRIVTMTGEELLARRARLEARLQEPGENKLQIVLLATAALFGTIGCAILWWLYSRKPRPARPPVGA